MEVLTSYLTVNYISPTNQHLAAYSKYYYVTITLTFYSTQICASGRITASTIILKH